MSLADQRKDYSLAGLVRKTWARDPFRQFEQWFQEAEARSLPVSQCDDSPTATRDWPAVGTHGPAQGASMAAALSSTATTKAARPGAGKQRARQPALPWSRSSGR